MPGGNDNEVNALYEIACNTRQMALNAGATPGDSGYINDEAALTNAIACNLSLTITALGGSCQPTWVDMATAWQAILIMTVELASLTGAPSNQGFLELPLAGVLCNLQQVAINTGGGPPPDPLQEFIDAVNAFNPDRFFLFERDTFSDAGGTVPSVVGGPVQNWKDQAGSGTHFVPHPSTPGIPTLGVDGVLMNAPFVISAMTQAYVPSGPDIFFVVVAQQDVVQDANARLASYSSGAHDYDQVTCFTSILTDTQWVLYQAGTTHGSILPGQSLGTFHLLSGYEHPGANQSEIFADGVSQPGTSGTITALAITNHGLNFQATGADGFFCGRYKAYAVWGTKPSDPDIAAIRLLFKNFYGTP